VRHEREGRDDAKQAEQARRQPAAEVWLTMMRISG
jgi:hypothetical protein